MANDTTNRNSTSMSIEDALLEARTLDPQGHDCDAPIDHRAEFIREQNQCCLCGVALEFTYKIEFSEDPVPNMLMREEAHCPACRIPLRRDRHAIQ